MQYNGNAIVSILCKERYGASYTDYGQTFFLRLLSVEFEGISFLKSVFGDLEGLFRAEDENSRV